MVSQCEESIDLESNPGLAKPAQAGSTGKEEVTRQVEKVTEVTGEN